MRETRVWQAVRRHPRLCDAALALAVRAANGRFVVRAELPRAMTSADRDRAQLVVIAYRSGLVRPGEQP